MGEWGTGVLDISGIVVALLILAVWVVVVLAAGAPGSQGPGWARERCGGIGSWMKRDDVSRDIKDYVTMQ